MKQLIHSVGQRVGRWILSLSCPVTTKLDCATACVYVCVQNGRNLLCFARQTESESERARCHFLHIKLLSEARNAPRRRRPRAQPPTSKVAREALLAWAWSTVVRRVRAASTHRLVFSTQKMAAKYIFRVKVRFEFIRSLEVFFEHKFEIRWCTNVWNDTKHTMTLTKFRFNLSWAHTIRRKDEGRTLY